MSPQNAERRPRAEGAETAKTIAPQEDGHGQRSATLTILTTLPFHPDGLHLLARASASYDTLRRHLGAPTSPWDSEKTHAEWLVETPLGPLNVYDYGDLHNCRITPPEPGERYPTGCRRNPAHRNRHQLQWHWSVQAQDTDAVAWLAHLDGVAILGDGGV